MQIMRMDRKLKIRNVKFPSVLDSDHKYSPLNKQAHNMPMDNIEECRLTEMRMAIFNINAVKAINTHTMTCRSRCVAMIGN